jgi:hypothetical protein
MLTTAAPGVFAGLLVNYQFETVDGDVPMQTTPDSTGNFVSSNNGVDPAVNALLGYGTNTPGTDYPQLASGPVTNATVQSLNPNNYMSFYSDIATTASRNNYTQVQIADAAAGALDATFTNFSVALWLNPSENTSDRFAIGKIGTNGNRGWQIYGAKDTNDLTLDYFSTTDNGTDRTLTLTNALPLNTWTHVAFTFDGNAGTEALYINGVLQSPTITGSLTSVPTVLNAANNQPFRVGHRGATGSAVGGWVGGIDDVRVYDQTLTATEVQSLMTAASTPVSGDFDGDGDVDGADFVVWQTHYPTASGGTTATGDANGDGTVDGADFAAWQTSFPTSPSAVAPVPEPSALTLVALGGILAACGRSKFARKAR